MIFVKKSLILFIMVINYFIRDTCDIQLGAFCSSSRSVHVSQDLPKWLVYNQLQLQLQLIQYPLVASEAPAHT